MSRTDDDVCQKPSECSVIDAGQKFAQVLGASTNAFSSVLQSYPLDTTESADIPVATVLKDDVSDVYLTPGGSASTFGALLADTPADIMMDLPLSVDNRDIDDQGWLYSIHETSMFDIGDMQNVDYGNNVAFPTEIRTDTWSKEINDFLNIPQADSLSMDLSIFTDGGSKVADDQEFYNQIFSSGHSFEDIVNGFGTMATEQSDQTSSTNVQEAWLLRPNDLPRDEDNTPIVAELSSEETPASPSATNVLETLLKTPFSTTTASSPTASAPTVSAPPSPDVNPPLFKSSKPKNTMLLFGKHENEIMGKLKGLKKSEKRSKKKKLVAMPVEEFNVLLEQSQLCDIEVAFMKEWRRRGKNKTAAQCARKRKREEMSGLDVEVEQLKRQNKAMMQKYEQLMAQVAVYKDKTIKLEAELLRPQNIRAFQSFSSGAHLLPVQ